MGGKTKRKTLGACDQIKVEAARVLAQAYPDELSGPLSVTGGEAKLPELVAMMRWTGNEGRLFWPAGPVMSMFRMHRLKA